MYIAGPTYIHTCRVLVCTLTECGEIEGVWPRLPYPVSINMASGASPLVVQEAAGAEASCGSLLSSSPEPAKLRLQEDLSELEGARASPRLSRKALDELGPENESRADDPENYPLHSPWSFWYDR